MNQNGVCNNKDNVVYEFELSAQIVSYVADFNKLQVCVSYKCILVAKRDFFNRYVIGKYCILCLKITNWWLKINFLNLNFSGCKIMESVNSKQFTLPAEIISLIITGSNQVQIVKFKVLMHYCILR